MTDEFEIERFIHPEGYSGGVEEDTRERRKKESLEESRVAERSRRTTCSTNSKSMRIQVTYLAAALFQICTSNGATNPNSANKFGSSSSPGLT